MMGLEVRGPVLGGSLIEAGTCGKVSLFWHCRRLSLPSITRLGARQTFAYSVLRVGRVYDALGLVDLKFRQCCEYRYDIFNRAILHCHEVYYSWTMQTVRKASLTCNTTKEGIACSI